MAKSHSVAVKPERTVPIRLEVIRSLRISPSFVRVTVGGGEIDRFEYRGFDQWFRLFLAPEGASELVLPNRDGWGGYAQLLTTRKDVRPAMRNYTVRAYRPASASEGAELDIDFVLHTAESGQVEGVAANWALSCTPGDAVGLLDEGYGYDPSPAATWHLLVTDETGLPAIAGICASLPADARGLAIIEVPEEGDIQAFAAPSGVEVRWLPRGAGHHRIGALAYAEAVAARLPGDSADPAHPGPVAHAYAVGESGLATGMRRHLVSERGWAKTAVSFCGYWRLPKGAPAVDELSVASAASAA